MTDQELVQIAFSMHQYSYVPYSHFHCSAALLCSDGTIFQGVNIENAAYTPTICAERCAIFKAVSEGYRDFKAIAVVGCDEKVLESNEFKNHKVLPEGYGKSGPCGVCRQVMREFTDPETFQIILAKSKEDYKVFTLKELLPESFGPENL